MKHKSMFYIFFFLILMIGCQPFEKYIYAYLKKSMYINKALHKNTKYNGKLKRGFQKSVDKCRNSRLI